MGNTVSILISETESRLKALRIKEIEGIMICSHAQWLEEGEGSTGTFFICKKLKLRDLTSRQFTI